MEKPDSDTGYDNVGEILQRLHKVDTARFAQQLATDIRRCRGAPGWSGQLAEVASPSGLADLYHVAGNVLASARRYDGAMACYRKSLNWVPDSTRVLSNWAGTLLLGERDAEALPVAMRAVNCGPDYPPAWTNLAKAYYRLDRIDEAIDSFQRAIQLGPKGMVAITCWEDLGCALLRAARLTEAIDAFRALVALDRQRPSSHLNLAIALLKHGEFSEGWDEFAWRVATYPSEYVPLPGVPYWNGEVLHGKLLLLHTEHGFGDSIQFVRYVTLLHERGIRVAIRCQRELKRLFTSIPGVTSIYSTDEMAPTFNSQVHLMSLPRILKTRLDSIPSSVPYFTPEPELVKSWSSRLAAEGGPMVGLAWAGSPNHGDLDRRRSLSLQTFAPFGSVPVTYVSLQKGHADIRQSAVPENMRIVDPSADLLDFADTAALIANLDLVISVDTSVAHLAGALGKPVWLLCRFDGDWRWLADRDDSPWYPTMRIFRQSTPGDWTFVMSEIAIELARLCAASWALHSQSSPSV